MRLILAKKICHFYQSSIIILTKSEYYLDKYFQDWVMSVHFLEDQAIVRKTGKPWWRHMESGTEVFSSADCKKLVKNLLAEVEMLDDAFLEIDRSYSKVLQTWPYRIVIVMPPLSKKIEVTAVRPVINRTLEQYELPDTLKEYLLTKATWVLITWSPWEGKSTFATAYVNELATKNVVIKTIESPRDLQVDSSISQYSFSHAPHSEIRDILLLSRPDFSIYDEIRNKEDFILFKDLRLTWIGLIGVMHATKPIDGVQRMIWTIELGLIPQVVDTIMYIKWGEVSDVYTLEQTVKTPMGMTSEDLARPVILVTDLATGEIKYEMYNYGDSVVVMPAEMIQKQEQGKHNAVSHFAKEWLEEFFSQELRTNVIVTIENAKRILVYVPDQVKPRMIGKWWVRIQAYEKELWVSIWVRDIIEYWWKHSNHNQTDAGYQINEVRKGKKIMLHIQLSKDKAHQEVSCLVWWKLMTFVVNHHWVIQIRRRKLIELIQWWDFAIVEE